MEYECIYTLTEALPYSRREDGSEAKNASTVIKLCSDHLRKFIEESDQNLKYLGLVGLCNLMKSSPRSVVDHRDIILSCLTDDDITIRSKALELLAGIVSKKSLVDLVHHLLQVIIDVNVLMIFLMSSWLFCFSLLIACKTVRRIISR